MTTTKPAPEPQPADPPKPANPEPVQHEESDPETGRVRDPGEGHSEHPKQ